MKVPQIKLLLENRPVEVQFVLLICLLGSARITLALIIDFTRPVLNLPELLIDFSIFILFITLLFLALRKLSLTKVHPVFGLLIILLLGFNFLQFGGVNGTNCFNFYTGIFVIVMLYSGRTLYFMISIQLIILTLLLFLVYINHPLYQSVLIHIDTTSSSEFVFSLLAISLFTYYLKRITVYEIENLEVKIQEVNIKVKESKILNQELIVQSKELKKAQKILQAEVSVRAKDLENQSEAIEQYIQYNTATLQDPLLRLTKAVQEFKGDTQLHVLLTLSYTELNEVITGINQALQSEAKLNRSTLNKRN